MKSVLFRVLKMVEISKIRMTILFLMIIFSQLMMAAFPKMTGKITDLVLSFAKEGSFDIPLIARICTSLVFLILAARALEAISAYILVAITEKTIKKIRDQAHEKLNRLPLKYLDNQYAGDILSRLTNDITSLTNVIGITFKSFMEQGVKLAAILVLMAIIDIRLTLMYLVILAIGYVVTSMVSKRASANMQVQARMLGALSALSSDTYKNHKMVKAYHCEKQLMELFREKNNRQYQKYIRTNFLVGLTLPTTTLASGVAIILLCVFGGTMLINGNMTLGEFQAFLIYGNMIQSPMTKLAAAYNSIGIAKACGTRVFGFLDEEEMSDESEKAELSAGGDMENIEFSDISFGYDPDKKILKNLSLDVSSGQTVAITGSTGSGKSTIINLLLRYYDADRGDIRIDGESIYDVTRSSIRKRMGVVLQDSWIFDGTIEENIRYGKPDATHEEVILAAKKAFCDVFIDKLEEGYNTRISADEERLSSGQLQLINIARAMIADPEILILDEATSQVDITTEYYITRAMQKLMEGRTCFIIAHRLATIRSSDLILYLDAGNIKERGTHEELMNMQGKYAELVRSNQADTDMQQLGDS